MLQKAQKVGPSELEIVSDREEVRYKLGQQNFPPSLYDKFLIEVAHGILWSLSGRDASMYASVSFIDASTRTEAAGRMVTSDITLLPPAQVPHVIDEAAIVHYVRTVRKALGAIPSVGKLRYLRTDAPGRIGQYPTGFNLTLEVQFPGESTVKIVLEDYGVVSDTKKEPRWYLVPSIVTCAETLGGQVNRTMLGPLGELVRKFYKPENIVVTRSTEYREP